MLHEMVERAKSKLYGKRRYEIGELVGKALRELRATENPQHFILLNLHDETEIATHLKNNLSGISAVEVQGEAKERAMLKMLEHTIKETFESTNIPTEHIHEDVKKLKTLEELMGIPHSIGELEINEYALAEIVQEYEKRYAQFLDKISKLRQREDVRSKIEKNYKIIANKIAQVLILLHKNGVIKLVKE